MDRLKEDLDLLVLEILETMETLYSKQDMLEQNMKSGYLGVSRSRYILGVKSISADQLQNADLIANKAVTVDDQLESSVFTPYDNDSRMFGHREDKRFIQLLNDNDKESTETHKRISTGKLMVQDSVNYSNVRKRNIATDSGELKENQNQSIKLSDEKGKEGNSSFEENIGDKRKKTNPLNLFGVLVPQSLHLSQKHFVEAVKIATDLADLRCKLSLQQEELKKLRKQKVIGQYE